MFMLFEKTIGLFRGVDDSDGDHESSEPLGSRAPGHGPSHQRFQGRSLLEHDLKHDFGLQKSCFGSRHFTLTLPTPRAYLMEYSHAWTRRRLFALPSGPT